MFPINLALIFIFCLALVIFSALNMESVTIHLVGGQTVSLPLAIELVVAMGIGAGLTWLFGLWSQFQRMLTRRDVRQRDKKIETLEQDIARYKADLMTQPSLPPASPSTESSSAA